MSNILTEANEVVSQRQVAYGTREKNFFDIAQMWSVILGHQVQASEVALCMIALKICRELFKHSHDNLVEIAGYAQCLEDLTETPNPFLTPDQSAILTKFQDTIKRFKPAPSAPWEVPPQHRESPVKWEVTC